MRVIDHCKSDDEESAEEEKESDASIHRVMTTPS